MIRLLNVGLGLVALWLGVLLLAGELGGWAHLLVLAALVCVVTALVLWARRGFTLRSGSESAEYE